MGAVVFGAVILGQKWAEFGICAELQKLFKPGTHIQSSHHASKQWICMAYRHVNGCCGVFGAVILGQKWAEFGILAELQKLFKPDTHDHKAQST